MPHTGFVQDLAVVLGVAAITGFLFNRLRQPSILGYLLAGLIVGPYLPIPLFADPERVHALSELGVVLVMFAVGLEFRISKFLSVLPTSGVTGLVEIAALLTSGYLLGIALGWVDIRAVFLGACICISSTMAVSKILEQRPVADENRQLIYGVLVLQDVAAIALIAVMTALAKGSEASVGEVLSILGKLCAALVGLVAVGMFFVPRFMRMLERTGSKEVLAVGGVGLCFSFALVAEQFGYSSALGAFIGGVLVAESGLAHQVETATGSVRNVFVAVFFVSIGMSVDPRLAWETLPTSLAVVGVIVVAQFISVTVAGTLSGNGLRGSLTAGLALGQIGEFAFIIGAIGVSRHVLGPEFQSILVTVAVLSTFTTSLALSFQEPIVSRVESLLPQRLKRVLVLYESWWQQLRQPSNEPKHTVRVIVSALLLDLALVAVIILSWQAWQEELGSALIGLFGLGDELSKSAAVAALGLALLPLLITLFIATRALASNLSDRLFDKDQLSSRALLRAALWATAVAAIGIPATFILGRAVGIAYVWPAFLAAAVLSVWIAWRKVGNVDSELQSGGLIVLKTIAGQGFEDEHHRLSRPTVPGIRNLLEVKLEENDFAVGLTLTAIDLRARTGANVVAIHDHQGASTIPNGTETLQVGDSLYVVGNAEAQAAAEGLLRSGPPPGSSDSRLQ